jgi:hypothetical protein
MSKKKTTKKEVLELIRTIYNNSDKDVSYAEIYLSDTCLLEVWRYSPGMTMEIHKVRREVFIKNIEKTIPKTMKWIKENIGYEEAKLKLEEHILTNI